MAEPIPQMTINTPPALPTLFPANGLAEDHAISQPPAAPQYLSEGLIFDDGIPMETYRHRQQMNLLIESLYLHWEDRNDFYVSGNMFVYFSPDQVKTEDFRGPDFFVVLGVDGRRERKGWVVWEEGGKVPDVVVELLSDSTAEFDRTRKKEIYATRLGVGEYYLCDPWGEELDGFVLKNGVYKPLPPDADGRLISPALELAFVRRWTTYQGVTTDWLRFETLDGELLLSGEERARLEGSRADQERHRADQESSRAEQESLRAEQESLRAEQERHRADQESLRAEQERHRADQESLRAEQEKLRSELLAAKLREMGIDPASLS